MMDRDGKFLMFLCVCISVGIISLVLGISYSNYLFTVRMKDCISAGYEWVHLPNYGEMECRKMNK